MRIKYVKAKLLIMLLIALGTSNAPVALADTNTQALVSQVQVRKYSANDQLSHLHEAVIIKNDSEDELDITNWCIYYASVAADFSDGTKRKIGCFTPANSSEKLFLEGNSIVRLGSFEASFFDPSIFYLPSFSQGLGNEKGKILLLDGGVEKDRVEWGVHPNALDLKGGAVFGRKVDDRGVLIYTGISNNDFKIIENIDITSRAGIIKKTDVCLETTGFQLNIEECTASSPTNNPSLEDYVAPVHTLQITEFFANPSGTDTGKEFIELYNFGDGSVNLAEYTLIVEGSSASSKKTHKLPDMSIQRNEYIALYNNTPLTFSLNNTAGKISIMHSSQVVDESRYTNTKEGYSWALIGDGFSLAIPSPNAPNLLEDIVLVDDKGKITEVKPCAIDQERNPLTGRCRKIATVAAPTPCKAGQERNPATGRCRNIPVKKTPTPCKVGQERNPATGRCRNIKLKIPPKTGDGVKAVAIKESETFLIWVLAAVMLTGALGYIGWEWRHEIKQYIKRINPNKKNDL